jgi:murein DD-endopeptidase MepM/ murein hydrolase activator NlpD
MIPLLLAAVCLALCIVTIPLFFRDLTPSTEAHTAAPPALPEVRRETIHATIENGATVSALLGKWLTPAQITELAAMSKPVFPLVRIAAGQPYNISLIDDRFDRFEYDIDSEEQFIVTSDGETLNVSRTPIVYETRSELVEGTIQSSLFEAVTAVGESAELAMNLADIFAWDIDFILDIRSGDAFKVLVERRFRDDKPAGYGRILGATFTNQGQTYRAYLFKDGEHSASYYDEGGESVRKMFLKAPLSFSRISSGFTMKRFHPITKTWKSHPAIDYAAPTGTPIKAVGDGTIVKIGKDRSNGRHIKLRHNGTYQTLYLHMNAFARGMKQGKKVSQGQIIGYVGSTGLATGPHLCFRMYKNGTPVNPAKVRARSAEPVSDAARPQFFAAIEPIVNRLESPTLLARHDPMESPRQ